MEEKVFFFEKKNQKTFSPWRVGAGEHTRQRPKVFCFFSEEKKAFLSRLAAPMHGPEPLAFHAEQAQ
jgi:hypothetical protein